MTVSAIAEHPCLVGGRARDVDDWREVVSPFDGSVVARVAWAGPAIMRDAVAKARAAMRAPLPSPERAAILRRASTLVLAHGEELARILCAEAGKPLKAARVEVERAASTLALSAEEATRVHGEQIPLHAGIRGHGPLAFTVRKPVGVVAAITPFNFPLNLVAHKVGPAIAAGCAVVVKPADKAPGPAVRLAELLVEAGLPPDWISVVTGPPAELAEVLLAAPEVRLVSFTGSAAIGWDLHRRARAKPVKLELGNVTPAIVAADADLDVASSRLAAGAFSNSGQACISVQRIYVERPVYDAFVADFATRVRELVTGDPADEATDVGPLITPEATERLLEWIGEARAGGATVVAGGELDAVGVLRPTVLVDAPASMRVACEEAFGPVVCVWPYDALDDAIAAANATDHGLQAGLFTSDLGAILRASDALEFAGVIVNDSPSFRADEMPYGGIKESGNTREGPAFAVREMTEECLVVLNP